MVGEVMRRGRPQAQGFVQTFGAGTIRIRGTESGKDEDRTFKGAEGKALADERPPCLSFLFVSEPKTLAEEEEGGERPWISATDPNAAGSYTSQPSSSTSGAFCMA